MNEMVELKAKVARQISVDSFAEVNKLTGAKVKEAVMVPIFCLINSQQFFKVG